MTATSSQGDGARGAAGFRRMWNDIESLGLDADTGGYHRFAWTREDHDLREWFTAECGRARPRRHDRPDGQPVGLVG